MLNPSLNRQNIFGKFLSRVCSLNTRLFIGFFGLIMFPTLTVATLVYIACLIGAPPVDIDGIREPVAGSLLY
jgi:photosystem II P680 reaction center D1 protein